MRIPVYTRYIYFYEEFTFTLTCLKSPFGGFRNRRHFRQPNDEAATRHVEASCHLSTNFRENDLVQYSQRCNIGNRPLVVRGLRLIIGPT